MNDPQSIVSVGVVVVRIECAGGGHSCVDGGEMGQRPARVAPGARAFRPHLRRCRASAPAAATRTRARASAGLRSSCLAHAPPTSQLQRSALYRRRRVRHLSHVDRFSADLRRDRSEGECYGPRSLRERDLSERGPIGIYRFVTHRFWPCADACPRRRALA